MVKRMVQWLLTALVILGLALLWVLLTAQLALAGVTNG
jgi:hypothetical protein